MGNRLRKFFGKAKSKRSLKTGAESGVEETLADIYLRKEDPSNYITEHQEDIDRVCEMYHVNKNTGLTEIADLEGGKAARTLSERSEADVGFVLGVREQYGPNEIPTKDKSFFARPHLIYIMCDGFTLLMWIGAIGCFVGYFTQKSTSQVVSSDSLWLGVVLTGVVIIASCFTLYQYNRSIRIINKFKNLVPPKAFVFRNGRFRQVLVRELVPGDIVTVKKGDKIPADMMIIKSHGLIANESNLKGEDAKHVKKQLKTLETDMFKADNLLFYSTFVTAGRCSAIVLRTGKRTVYGKVSEWVTARKVKKTPIHKEVKFFRRIISVIAFAIGITFGFIALGVGYSVVEAGVFTIGLIVANVPEGLNATLNVAVALSAKRMAARKCHARNLEVVETVGAVSVILTAKTGIITHKNLRPGHIFTPRKKMKLIEVNGDLAMHFDKKTEGWSDLAPALALCSTAWFAPHDEDLPVQKRKVIGDSTETGLLKLFTIVEGNVEEINHNNPKIIERPFNSTDKFNLTIHEKLRSKQIFILMKGAPEAIFKFCDHYMIRDNRPNRHGVGKREGYVRMKFDPEYQLKLMSRIDSLGKRGERVIAFCRLDLPGDKYGETYGFEPGVSVEKWNFPKKGYRFLGLVSLEDVPKDNVTDAVKTCRNAGIRLIMTTGDDAALARIIAEKVGIISKEEESEDTTTEADSTTNASSETGTKAEKARVMVITGHELQHMDLKDLCQTLYSRTEIVFARIAPEQKKNIVEALRTNGFVVAVTGDDVNDADALRLADVGISLGDEGGTDISRENADMILLEDNFASIVSAIEEGRLVFDNLKKFLVYTLSSNIPEMLPFVAFIVLGVPLPLGTVTILFIDLGTDLIPGISLAYEAPEKDLMNRRPRNPKDHLVNTKMIFMSYGLVGVIQAVAGFFMYVVIMAEHGFLPHTLIGLRNDWENQGINDLKDSYRQEWSYPQRKQLEYLCHSGFFLAMVQVQWADLIIAKTRKRSIFEQGMGNYYLDFALIFETLLLICLIYIPGTPTGLRLYALSPYYWIPALPYALIIWVFDEWRRYFIRKYPKGFMVSLTYY